MKRNSVAASRQSAAKRQKKNAALCRKPLRLRREFRAWRASLPTQLERDTLLTQEWVAECVVQEVERFLKADLPENFAERLAVKAHYLYPRHKHFHKGLNRPGNRGRENLLMFMRHWTAGWLKRERPALYKKLRGPARRAGVYGLSHNGCSPPASALPDTLASPDLWIRVHQFPGSSTLIKPKSTY